MSPRSSSSKRHLSSSASVRNHGQQHHRSVSSDNSLDERDPLSKPFETEDEIHTRRLIKALAEQSYHLPGYGYWDDMIQWFLNNHPILGICFHHRLHPIGCGMRMLGFFASGVFGLAITNLVWLWFIYEEDETRFTVDLSEASKANLTAYLDDVNESNELEITNGVIYLWTAGGALHGLFDTTIWKLSMCSCCEGLQAQGKYKRFGVGLMTFGVILITACTTLIVVFRATFENNDDADIAELKSAGIFDDAIELGSGGKSNYQFLLSYSVELALALVVYFPIMGIVMFSGILACKKPIPILGGRPYEVYLYEKAVAEEEEEARRRARRKDEFADEDIGGLRAALTKRASSLFAGKKASVHSGLSSNNRMNSSRGDLNASVSRLNSSRTDLNSSGSRLNHSNSRADLNASNSRLGMSSSRLHSSRADLNASGSRLHLSSGSLSFDEEMGVEMKDPKRRPGPPTSRESSRNLERDRSSRFAAPTRSSSNSSSSPRSPTRSSSRDERQTPRRTSSREYDRDDHRHSPRRSSSREYERDEPRYSSPTRSVRSRDYDRDDARSSSEPPRKSRDNRDVHRRSSSRDPGPRNSSSRNFERSTPKRTSSRDSVDSRSKGDHRNSSSRDFERSTPKRTSSRDSVDSRSHGDFERATPKRTSSRSSERNYEDRGSSSNREKRTGGSKVHDAAGF